MVVYALQVSPSAAEGETVGRGAGVGRGQLCPCPLCGQHGWNRQLQQIEGEQEYPPGAPESAEDLNTTLARQERPAPSLLGLNIPKAGKSSPSLSPSLPTAPHTLSDPLGKSLLW